MTGGAIDFHTHAFPDALAKRAIPALEAEAEGVTAFLDGKVSSLLRSMDGAGIERSVLCSIATRPGQFESILSWSKEVASERIIPFLSFHPDIPDYVEKIRIIVEEGFKGVKFHPFYQEFYLAEDRMMPIYEELARQGLVIVMHTGYDIAFERIRRCDPNQILTVMERVPELKLVTTHLGAWEMWDEVRDLLIGKPIYMELSFSIEYLGDSLSDMLLAHPKDYILFGTDSPWTGQKATIDGVKALGLPEGVEDALLRENALRLLGE
jgi:predicted TIM-barrel fold metal-dependent hydrolase